MWSVRNLKRARGVQTKTPHSLQLWSASARRELRNHLFPLSWLALSLVRPTLLTFSFRWTQVATQVPGRTADRKPLLLAPSALATHALRHIYQCWKCALSENHSLT